MKGDPAEDCDNLNPTVNLINGYRQDLKLTRSQNLWAPLRLQQLDEDSQSCLGADVIEACMVFA